MAEVTFENAFENLQTSVKRLESGQLTLEQSLLEYENGIKWSRICQEHLEKAERKLQTLATGSSNSTGQTEVQN